MYITLLSTVNDHRVILNIIAPALSRPYQANPMCPEVTAQYQGKITALCFLFSSIGGVAEHCRLGNQHYVIVAAPESELKATSLQFS